MKRPSEARPKPKAGAGGNKGATAKRSRRPVPKAQRVPGRQPASQETLAPPGESEVVPALEDYDSSALSQAKTHWFFGEWNALAELDLDKLRQHPDRDRFALLVAAAQQQLGRHEAALKSARLAMNWGCSSRLLAQILIAGVHNTLGRAAALANKETRAINHFKASVAAGATGSGSADLMGHARSVREVTKLGLLPQAAALVEQSLAKGSKLAERPEQAQARLKMLETEIDLLRGNLILAAQRRQLYSGVAADAPTGPPRPAGAMPPDASPHEATTSQLGQDLWVLEKTGYKRNGYFVEFGATDGVLLSNTYLLERGYGWKGICVEPHPGFFHQLKANRACIVSDACIAAESGRVVEFILADEFGGIAEFAGNDTHADKRRAFRALGKTVQMKTTSLHDLLVAHNAPRQIDYLSVDTEGSEYDILRAFPFDKWEISLITVEHNYSASRELLRELLEPLGYRRVEAQWDDWYFLTSAFPYH